MKFPILMYDDLCTSCTKYAMIVDKILEGKITCVGLYSPNAKELRKRIYVKSLIDPTKMSWFCKEGVYYGGRSGLIHLIDYILFEKKESGYQANVFNLQQCKTDCSTAKGVMFRSFSIITSSKEVIVDDIVGDESR